MREDTIAELEQDRDYWKDHAENVVGKWAVHWKSRAELAESTIRNRDETIAALRTALGGLLRCEYESAGHGLMDCIDNYGAHYQSQHLADQIKRAEALASPHQEGTGT